MAEQRIPALVRILDQFCAARFQHEAEARQALERMLHEALPEAHLLSAEAAAQSAASDTRFPLTHSHLCIAVNAAPDPLTATETSLLRSLAAAADLILADAARRAAPLGETEKLAMLGRTVAGVAHELNGPLQTIVSQAETLVAQDPEAARSEPARRILRSGLRCSGIVQDLLAFGTPRPPNLQAVDLRRCLLEALELDRWSDVGDLQVFLEEDEPLPAVNADPARLVQVFTNLLTNARTASLESGTREPVRVRMRRCGTDFVELSVCDRGPGVPAEARLFEAFSTTKPEGHGLGLWLSQRLLAECGGSLDHDATWKPGARFVVRLSVAHSNPQKSASQPATGLSVLVIDDDRELLETYDALLKLDDHSTITCDSAGKALDILAHRSFDAILCDLRLPDLSGERFFEQLRSLQPDLARRVIFASGDVGRSESLAFLAATGNPVLLKPFRAEDLSRALRQVSGRAQGGR